MKTWPSCSARLALPLALLVAITAGAAGTDEPRRITNLYDAFGAPSALKQDWGFAALIEYGGKRILFDTGNDAATFEHNVKQLGVDLGRLDAVVISHRHGDHTSGLGYLLLSANANLDTTLLFAVLVALMVIGLVLYYAVEIAERLMIPWHISVRSDEVPATR